MTDAVHAAVTALEQNLGRLEAIAECDLTHAEMLRMSTCRRKRRYDTWDEARRAGLLVSLENPRLGDMNAPTPYPCGVIEPPHYHYGHMKAIRKRRQC